MAESGLPVTTPDARTEIDTIQAELIRQYHERADMSPLMSDEDFDGLVL